jgi:hypothetical protein
VLLLSVGLIPKHSLMLRKLGTFSQNHQRIRSVYVIMLILVSPFALVSASSVLVSILHSQASQPPRVSEYHSQNITLTKFSCNIQTSPPSLVQNAPFDCIKNPRMFSFRFFDSPVPTTFTTLFSCLKQSKLFLTRCARCHYSTSIVSNRFGPVFFTPATRFLLCAAGLSLAISHNIFPCHRFSLRPSNLVDQNGKIITYFCHSSGHYFRLCPTAVTEARSRFQLRHNNYPVAASRANTEN